MGVEYGTIRMDKCLALKTLDGGHTSRKIRVTKGGWALVRRIYVCLAPGRREGIWGWNMEPSLEGENARVSRRFLEIAE
jgi:hypothetical protein